MSKYKVNKYKMLRLTNLDENLCKSEKLIYNHLILCFDEERGFAYPTYPELMQVLSVKRRNSVADTIDSLRAKEYIETKKGFRGANNYYLLKYVTSNETDTSIKNVTSNKTDTSTSNEIDTPLVTEPLLNNINNKLNNKVNINNTKKVSTKKEKTYIDLSEYEFNNVKVTQEEYEKLIKFANDDKDLVHSKMLSLEANIVNENKKYTKLKNHYMTIRNWLSKDIKPKAQFGKPSIDYSQMTSEQIMALGRGEKID